MVEGEIADLTRHAGGGVPALERAAQPPACGGERLGERGRPARERRCRIRRRPGCGSCATVALRGGSWSSSWATATVRPATAATATRTAIRRPTEARLAPGGYLEQRLPDGRRATRSPHARPPLARAGSADRSPAAGGRQRPRPSALLVSLALLLGVGRPRTHEAHPARRDLLLGPAAPTARSQGRSSPSARRLRAARRRSAPLSPPTPSKTTSTPPRASRTRSAHSGLAVVDRDAAPSSRAVRACARRPPRPPTCGARLWRSAARAGCRRRRPPP